MRDRPTGAAVTPSPFIGEGRGGGRAMGVAGGEAASATSAR